MMTQPVCLTHTMEIFMEAVHGLLTYQHIWHGQWKHWYIKQKAP